MFNFLQVHFRRHERQIKGISLSLLTSRFSYYLFVVTLVSIMVFYFREDKRKAKIEQLTHLVQEKERALTEIEVKYKRYMFKLFILAHLAQIVLSYEIVTILKLFIVHGLHDNFTRYAVQFLTSFSLNMKYNGFSSYLIFKEECKPCSILIFI